MRRLDSGRSHVLGDIELDGDAVRFVLRERRGSDQVVYSGSLRYASSRAPIPANFPIRGWTILRDSPLPEHGEPVTFDTQGEFQASLAAAAKPAEPPSATR